MNCSFSKYVTAAVLAGFSLSASSARADLIISWHDFDGAVTADPDNYATAGSGLSGFATSSVASTNLGGSPDGTYAFANVPSDGVGPPAPPINNGFITVLGGAVPSPAGFVNFVISNASSANLRLIATFFDAFRSGSGASLLSVRSGATLLGSTNTISTAGYSPQGTDSHSVALLPGSSITVTFSAPSGSRTFDLDNVAFQFVAIPEPGNVLGLSALLGSTLVMRNRRRKLTVAKA